MASAQTTLGYRQNVLTCNGLCSGTHQSDVLLEPWGVAFLPDQDFLIAEHNAGRVDRYDATGQWISGLVLPLPAGSNAVTSRPTGIVADPLLSFFIGATHFQFLVATEEGTIVGFNESNGQFTDARVVVDQSSNLAVYTGMTILHPACCSPELAVANFHSGEIEVYGLVRTALPGAFEDPSLPTGYSPYNIQTIGDQVFVTYALRDDSGRAPLIGSGLGIVSIFDQEGNFVRRFISDGGKLNAPWGITKASANFGPFANDILVGNIGDLRIEVYDPTTGSSIGPLLNSEQKVFLNPGIRALTFRSDHVGDPDQLYFVAAPQTNGVIGGQFDTISVGRLTSTQLTVSNTSVGVEATLVAQVTPVAGGDTAAGKVIFFDNGTAIGDNGLVGGLATIAPIFDHTGTHTITAEYQGTDNLLPSLDSKQLTVLGPTTTTTLSGPASAGPGTPVTFNARTLSPGVIVIGSVTFREGDTVLGSVPLDEHDTATLTITTLSPGTHSVTATYSGVDFQSSTSNAVQVFIGGDFQFSAGSPALAVTAGNSVQTTLTLSPNAGFAGPVTFSCSAPSGITCSFNPSTLNLNGATVSTTVTLNSSTTTATGSRGITFPFLAFGILGAVLVGRRKTTTKEMLSVIASVTVVLFMVACGGNQKPSVPPTPIITANVVTLSATSGTTSHSLSINLTVQR